MNTLIELLEIWSSCFTAALKDRSLAFPISVVVGLALGGLFWWIAALSAALWNKRFHMKVGLQVLCGVAALLAVLFAITFVSAGNMEQVIVNRINVWQGKVLSDQHNAWKAETFYRAWDAVADAKTEPTVTKSNNPRLTGKDRLLAMDSPDARQAAIRVYVNATKDRFQLDQPYLHYLLFANRASEMPVQLMNQSLVEWFRDNSGSYPLTRAVDLLARYTSQIAKEEAVAAAEYTRRLSVALFLTTQMLVFVIIALVAYRSNKPVVS